MSFRDKAIALTKEWDSFAVIEVDEEGLEGCGIAQGGVARSA
jgi:hypothetical protein